MAGGQTPRSGGRGQGAGLSPRHVFPLTPWTASPSGRRPPLRERFLRGRTSLFIPFRSGGRGAPFISYIKLKNPRIVLSFILFLCTPLPSSTCRHVKFGPRGQAMPVGGSRVGAQPGVEGALRRGQARWPPCCLSLQSQPPAPESSPLRESPTGRAPRWGLLATRSSAQAWPLLSGAGFCVLCHLE